MEQSKIIDTLETYHVARRAAQPHAYGAPDVIMHTPNRWQGARKGTRVEHSAAKFWISSEKNESQMKFAHLVWAPY